MKGKYEMGHLRFRKSIKILPGVKLNLNKKSASVTVGSKGMHHTVSTNGNTTTSVGIPGTGLSYVETKSKKKKSKNAEIIEPETTSDSYNTNLEYALPKETKMKKPKKQKRKIIISIIIGILILGIIGGLLPPSLESIQASITQNENVPGSGEETSGSTSTSQEEVVAPPPVSTYVWIPQSGSKYHSNPSCSNMENPTQVTKEKAESMGFTPCKKCY